MSGVSAGRLLMLILNVINPASSFDTAMVVMSGALGSSPVESVKVWLFTAECDARPKAALGTTARRAARTARSTTFDLTLSNPLWAGCWMVDGTVGAFRPLREWSRVRHSTQEFDYR